MPKKNDSCTSYIPMAFLISIIVFLYGTFLGAYIPPLLVGEQPSSLVLSGDFLKPYGYPLPYMVVMNTLFFMMALSFSCAHFSDPGHVPYEWVRGRSWGWEGRGRGGREVRQGGGCFFRSPLAHVQQPRWYVG